MKGPEPTSACRSPPGTAPPFPSLLLGLQKWSNFCVYVALDHFGRETSFEGCRLSRLKHSLLLDHIAAVKQHLPRCRPVRDAGWEGDTGQGRRGLCSNQQKDRVGGASGSSPCLRSQKQTRHSYLGEISSGVWPWVFGAQSHQTFQSE